MGKHKLKLPEINPFLSSHRSHVDPASSEIQMHFEITRLTGAIVQKIGRKLSEVTVKQLSNELQSRTDFKRQIVIIFMLPMSLVKTQIFDAIMCK